MCTPALYCDETTNAILLSEQESSRKSLVTHKPATVHSQAPATSKPTKRGKDQPSTHKTLPKRPPPEIPTTKSNTEDPLPTRKQVSAKKQTIAEDITANDDWDKSGSTWEVPNMEECEIVDVICNNFGGDLDSDTESELSIMAEEIVTKVVGDGLPVSSSNTNVGSSLKQHNRLGFIIIIIVLMRQPVSSSYRESEDKRENREATKKEGKTVRFSDSTSTEPNYEQPPKTNGTIELKDKSSSPENQKENGERRHHDGKV